MEIPFAASSGPSLGVEWELEIVDPVTRQLVGAASPLLDALGSPQVKAELFACCVELVTGVCGSVAEAEADLAATLGLVQAEAEHAGHAVMCSGTHPITDWADQQITADERYERLVEQMRWPARRLQIFGVHVHVGVRSAEKAIPIVNALTAYMPHLLALSASSPYWMGTDTGLASARSKIFEGLPTAGVPHRLAAWADFETYMETLLTARTISSIKEVWWDIRPHPDFGTVELRMCDGLPTLFEVGTIAALAQSLVQRLDTQLDDGYGLPAPPEWVVRENKWRAARHGIDCEVIVDERGTTRPLREHLLELIDDLTPIARRLGCVQQLHRVDDLLKVGPSYQRQRAVAAAAGGSLDAVVDGLLAEMRTGRPA
ncbi:MAG TPA: glutamate--cysteine ligase [Mycobacteriales bacterium]|nr:glutamate--cysteine ligase [Mycobacteriales bacterium]